MGDLDGHLHHLSLRFACVWHSLPFGTGIALAFVFALALGVTLSLALELVLALGLALGLTLTLALGSVFGFASHPSVSALSRPFLTPFTRNTSTYEVATAPGSGAEMMAQFFLGDANSGAPHHFHLAAANYLAFGRKLWALLPPDIAVYDVSPAVDSFYDAGNAVPGWLVCCGCRLVELTVCVLTEESWLGL